jgi:YggT family protein
MFVFGNILIGVARVLDGVLFVYQLILIARAVLSWVSPDPRNPIVQFLYAVTEPPIRAVRRRLPMSLRYFPVDIAFLVVFGIVIFAEYGIVPSLVEAGLRLNRDPALSQSAPRATLT